MTGENNVSATNAPKISIALFTNAFSILLSGTLLILITGSPTKSSVYGFVGMILL